MIDDAVLVLSELLSNACRHGRPLRSSNSGNSGNSSNNGSSHNGDNRNGSGATVDDGDVRAAWRVDDAGRLTVEVTDGGGPTRPVPATPSVTARGGRGLNIIKALAEDWGVRDDAPGEVTVWVVIAAGNRHDDFATRVASPSAIAAAELQFADPFEDLS